jgi:membrane protein implicated in regulation of membrane protease activity
MTMEMPVEKKESKTGAIIGTVAAIVLCGLPGLCLLCPGGIAVLAGWANYSNVGFDIPTWSGAIFLCLSAIFIAIAVVVPILLLRKKKPDELAPVLPDEPLPPVS